MIFRKKEQIKVMEIFPLVIFRIYIGGKGIYKMQCVIESDNTLLISDIVSDINSKTNKYINRGYGSKLMTRLFEYAKENDIREIYGNLSIVDMDHKDRLEHFYKKFGFNITFYDEEETYFGLVKKVLK